MIKPLQVLNYLINMYSIKENIFKTLNGKFCYNDIILRFFV